MYWRNGNRIVQADLPGLWVHHISCLSAICYEISSWTLLNKMIISELLAHLFPILLLFFLIVFLIDSRHTHSTSKLRLLLHFGWNLQQSGQSRSNKIENYRFSRIISETFHMELCLPTNSCIFIITVFQCPKALLDIIWKQ